MKHVCRFYPLYLIAFHKSCCQTFQEKHTIIEYSKLEKRPRRCWSTTYSWKLGWIWYYKEKGCALIQFVVLMHFPHPEHFLASEIAGLTTKFWPVTPSAENCQKFEGMSCRGVLCNTFITPEAKRGGLMVRGEILDSLFLAISSCSESLCATCAHFKKWVRQDHSNNATLRGMWERLLVNFG